MATQSELLMDINVPVLQISDYAVLVPLIGMLDSSRTQRLMEDILENIKKDSVKVVIIDILGISTIDSAVAAHLLKVTKATRLMGADTVISGISPVIAQTIVNLGVNLEGITTTGSLKDAIKLSNQKMGFDLVKVNNQSK